MKRSSIQAINRDVVHQICSGQVVLNLATAVKELVENSLDAGATVVEVRLREYGSELVEVIDNGLGVEEENFEGLTLKHHTSKLKEFSDLVSVETFGFRGEALSSLCALSEMIITTRHATASHGTRLEFDYRGHIVKRTPCARQIGTTVTLQNIFGTLPVRHKEFHRNLRREFSKMSQLLYAYCLVSTGTKITCINQNKKGGRTVVVSTQGSESVRENIACVFGAKQVQCLMDLDQKPPSESILQESGLPTEISSSETTFQLEGYISSCAHGQGRSAADRQFYYVNSRPCEPSKVTKVVNEVYHQFNQHQYPFVFLNLKMARDAVDVNVTPDKRQIFLEQEKLLIATIKASLLQLYETIPSTFHFQNIPTNFPAQISSPPTPTSTPSSPASGSLTDRFKQWSHSRASVSTSPTSGKGVKRVSEFAKQEENKKSKLHCIDNFFSPALKTTNTENSVIDITSKVSSSPEDVYCVNNLNSITNPEISEHNSSLVNVDMRESNNVRETELDEITQNEENEENDKSNSECPNEDIPLHINHHEYDVDAKCANVSTNYINSVTNNRMQETESDYIDVVKKDIDTESERTNSESELNRETHLSTCSKLTDLSAECTSMVVIKTDDEIAHDGNRKVVHMTVNLNGINEKLKNLALRKKEKDKLTRVRFRAEINPSKNVSAEQELQKEIAKDMFSKMEILGQFNLGFIVTRLEQDLFIIDQHATDEKYNFEMLQLNTVLQNQKLVIPQRLELTAVNESILLESEEVFRKNGFDFTIDENAEPTKRIQLTAVPVSRNWQFGKEDIDELVFMLQDAPNTMCRPSRVRAMFASRACRKSVMIGTALSKLDMRRLVDHMGEIEQPWNCPHGRPTMRHLVNLGLLKIGSQERNHKSLSTLLIK